MLKLKVACVLAICVGLLVAAQAQSPPFPGTFPQGIFTNRAALDASGFNASCSQSSTFLARTSGLSNTDKTNYDTMICGMVTDGTFSLLDGLYIFATNTTTTAHLNLIGTSGTLTYHGTPSESSQFSAFHGYTGDGSTVFLDTGLAPNALTNWSLNAATFGFYNLTSRTSGSDVEIGAFDGGANASYMLFFNTGPIIQIDVNSGAFTGISSGGANADGYWAATRITTGTINIYNNANSSTFGTISASAGSLIANTFYILANNSNGTASSFSSDQLSAVFLGNLSSGPGTASSNMATRLNTFMTAYGINKF